MSFQIIPTRHFVLFSMFRIEHFENDSQHTPARTITCISISIFGIGIRATRTSHAISLSIRLKWVDKLNSCDAQAAKSVMNVPVGPFINLTEENQQPLDDLMPKTIEWRVCVCVCLCATHFLSHKYYRYFICSKCYNFPQKRTNCFRFGLLVISVIG